MDDCSILTKNKLKNKWLSVKAENQDGEPHSHFAATESTIFGNDKADNTPLLFSYRLKLVEVGIRKASKNREIAASGNYFAVPEIRIAHRETFKAEPLNCADIW